MGRGIRLLTPNCNYNCVFCHNEGGPRVAGKSIGQGQIQEIVTQARKRGFEEKITLSGGEPLYHKDIGKIIEVLPNILNDCIVVTNGSLIRSIEINKLKTFDFHINIPSFVPRAYKYLTGQSTFHLYDIIDNCLSLLQNGIDVDVNYVLCNGINTDYKDLSLAISKSKDLGFRSIRFLELLPTNDAIQDLYFPFEDLLNLNILNEFSKMKSESPRSDSYVTPYGEFFIELIKCSCAIKCSLCEKDRDLYCTIDGRLMPCMVTDDFMDINRNDVSSCINNYEKYYELNKFKILREKRARIMRQEKGDSNGKKVS